MALNTLKSEIQFRLEYKIQKCTFHKKYTFKKVIKAKKKKENEQRYQTTATTTKKVNRHNNVNIKHGGI